MKKLLFLLILLLFCSNHISKEQHTTITNQTEEMIVKSILIGDSNVGVIKKTDGFKSSGIDIGPHKSGITTAGLIELLAQSPIDTIHNVVFVAIGTNDIYQTNNSNNLKQQIRKTYTKVKNTYVIWGSRGWGGV